MYSLVPNISQKEVSNLIFNDPHLVLLGASDEDIALMYKHKEYRLADGSHYVGVKEDDELIAVIKYEYFTTHAINYHMYLASKYHHTDKPRIVVDLLKKYVVEELGIRKVLIFVPSSCDHIHKFAPKHGLKEEGRITKCYQWREQIVDIVIYGLDL